MGNEEHLDDQIEDLEPAAEEAEDVKGGLNFTSDPAMKFQKVQPADSSYKFAPEYTQPAPEQQIRP